MTEEKKVDFTTIHFVPVNGKWETLKVSGDGYAAIASNGINVYDGDSALRVFYPMHRIHFMQNHTMTVAERDAFWAKKQAKSDLPKEGVELPEMEAR